MILRVGRRVFAPSCGVFLQIFQACDPLPVAASGPKSVACMLLRSDPLRRRLRTLFRAGSMVDRLKQVGGPGPDSRWSDAESLNCLGDLQITSVNQTTSW